MVKHVMASDGYIFGGMFLEVTTNVVLLIGNKHKWSERLVTFLINLKV